MRSFFTLLFAGLFVSGCVSPQTAANMRASIPRHVVCQGQQACSAAWLKAVNWVQSQQNLRMTMQTDNTLGADVGDRVDLYSGVHSPLYRITITKNPVGPDSYELVLRVQCPSGCMGWNMIGDEARFKDYMLGPV